MSLDRVLELLVDTDSPAGLLVTSAAIVALIALWAPLGGRLSVILGFATAGVAFAMQEVIGALFGWLNILAGRVVFPVGRDEG